MPNHNCTIRLIRFDDYVKVDTFECNAEMQDNVYWSERIGSGRIETVIVATAVNDEWNTESMMVDLGGSGKCIHFLALLAK